MFLDWKYVEMEQVLTLLLKMKEFINKDNWIDYPFAVDSHQLMVEPDSPRAVKWSLAGASELLSAQDNPKPLCDYVAVATREYLNDLSDDKLLRETMSYDDEVALIELAIEDLQGYVKKNSV